MTLLFRLRKAKFLFYQRKKNLVSSKEDYFALIKKSAEEYRSQKLVVKDENAKREADIKALFSIIPEHRDLGGKYGFTYSSDLSDKENVLEIMEHLTKHTHYCGETKNILPDDAAEILPDSFDLPFEKALNCRFKAIAFTDVLNSYGIKAFPVCAISNDKGIHFFVSVWLKEEKRFIITDPSFNCTFSNETGRELSVYELRDRIIDNKPVEINGYSFLGAEDFKDYYFHAFVRDEMANISTWKTNRRSKKELSRVCGVEFNARVPEGLL